MSLTEALDLTTPSGRAMAGLLSVFAEIERDVLRERILAGISQARKKGTRLGVRVLRPAKRKKCGNSRRASPSQKLHAGFRSAVLRYVACWKRKGRVNWCHDLKDMGRQVSLINQPLPPLFRYANAMTWFWRDIRYSLRLLAKSPLATAIAIVSLALGVGANTAIFSLINALILRALPVPNPGQLISISTIDPDEHEEHRLSLGMFEEIQKHRELFSGVFIWSGGELLNLEANGMEYPGVVDRVSGESFSTLDIKPLLGRSIKSGDVALDAGISNQVALISYACWRRRYDGDPHVLGQTIRLENRFLTIIGVMPKEFSSLDIDSGTDVVVPMGYSGQATFREPGRLSFSLFARLAAGVTLKRARAELKALWPHIQQATVPETYPTAKRARFFAKRIDAESAATGSSYLRRRFSRPLTVIMALVALVLLIACMNLANLMLARAASRQHEMGIRAALGAGGWALLRQLLLESLLLSAAGAALGFFVAFWASRFLVSEIWTAYIPLTLSVTPDLRVLFFTSGLAITTGVLVGVTPALRAKRTNPAIALRQGSRGIHGEGSFAKLLVSGQVAFSLVLVFGAILFTRSMANLLTVDPGFRRDHIVTMQLFPQPGRENIPNRAAYFRELAARLSRIPGVNSVSYSYYGPVNAFEFREPVASSSGNTSAQAMEDIVGPGFFHLIGMRLLEGREFSWRDDERAPRVAILSQSLAKKLFPNESPLGKMIEVEAKRSPLQVVGVVNSASLWRVQSHAPMAVYLALMQKPDYNQPSADIRTAADPSAIFSAARKAVENLRLQYPLDVETLEARTREMLISERMIAMLSAFMGGLALLLSAIGLYGLMSYVVTRRTSEIGTRMALGARTSDVLRLILRDVVLLVAVGIAVGIPSALAASRLIVGMLFGLSAADPLVIASSIFVLLGVALLAGYWPARRASRIDPVSALRAE